MIVFPEKNKGKQIAIVTPHVSTDSRKAIKVQEEVKSVVEEQPVLLHQVLNNKPVEELTAGQVLSIPRVSDVEAVTNEPTQTKCSECGQPGPVQPKKRGRKPKHLTDSSLNTSSVIASKIKRKLFKKRGIRKRKVGRPRTKHLLTDSKNKCHSVEGIIDTEISHNESNLVDKDLLCNNDALYDRTKTVIRTVCSESEPLPALKGEENEVVGPDSCDEEPARKRRKSAKTRFVFPIFINV